MMLDVTPHLDFSSKGIGGEKKKKELLQNLEEKTELRCELERSLPGAALPKAIFSSGY